MSRLHPKIHHQKLIKSFKNITIWTLFCLFLKNYSQHVPALPRSHHISRLFPAKDRQCKTLTWKICQKRSIWTKSIFQLKITSQSQIGIVKRKCHLSVSVCVDLPRTWHYLFRGHCLFVVDWCWDGTCWGATEGTPTAWK